MTARIDRLNPLTRLLIGLVLTVPLVVSIDWLSATIIVIGELIGMMVLGVRLTWLLPRLLPVAVAAPIGAVSMALYGRPGGRIYLDWGLVVISDASLGLAGAVLIRVFALALPAIALMGTVDPTDLADALTQLLRLPSRFVLGIVAGGRLVGQFTADWQTLALARRARGLGDSGRLRRWATMAFGLLVIALRRGTALSTAMEARGFGGQQRSRARQSRLHRTDLAAFACSMALAVVALLAAFVFDTAWVL